MKIDYRLEHVFSSERIGGALSIMVDGQDVDVEHFAEADAKAGFVDMFVVRDGRHVRGVDHNLQTYRLRGHVTIMVTRDDTGGVAATTAVDIKNSWSGVW